MSEQQFGWNYFENEVVIGDKQDKKRMIVVVFSNFMCIPYNRKAFDELVGLLNEQQTTIQSLKSDKAIAEDYANIFEKENVKLRKQIGEQQATINELQSIINHIKCEENCFDYDYCCETVCSLYNEIKHLKEENEQLKKARDKSDKFIVKKGLEIEFLEWCIK